MPPKVSVEVGQFVSAKLRSSWQVEDFSNAKIVGNPSPLALKESANVIGQIDRPWGSKVDYVRFGQRDSVIIVDFRIGKEFYSMKKLENKWLVYANGGMF